MGTASVKVLVVEVTGQDTHIWGHGEALLEGGYGPDGAIVDREAVAAACDAALLAAEEMSLGTFGHRIVPDRSLWSVPGWLCQGHTLTFDRRRPRLEKRISQREWLNVRAQLDDALTHLPGTVVDVIPTSQVNGSTVTDAVDLRGKKLALEAFVTTVAPETLAAFQHVAAMLELDPPAFVAQARAAAAGWPNEGLLLDIGRWGTHIVVAQQGRPAGATWVALGGQSLYRTLINSLGLPPSGLSSFCQAYAEGWLPPETAMAADAALADPVARWLDSAAENLAQLAIETSLPHHIYLAGGASRLPAVLHSARAYDWMHQLAWPRYPQIHLWQPGSASDLTNHTGHIWGASDLVRLGLARLAMDIA